MLKLSTTPSDLKDLILDAFLKANYFRDKVFSKFFRDYSSNILPSTSKKKTKGSEKTRDEFILIL